MSPSSEKDAALKLQARLMLAIASINTAGSVESNEIFLCPACTSQSAHVGTKVCTSSTQAALKAFRASLQLEPSTRADEVKAIEPAVDTIDVRASARKKKVATPFTFPVKANKKATSKTAQASSTTPKPKPSQPKAKPKKKSARRGRGRGGVKCRGRGRGAGRRSAAGSSATNLKSQETKLDTPNPKRARVHGTDHDETKLDTPDPKRARVHEAHHDGIRVAGASAPQQVVDPNLLLALISGTQSAERRESAERAERRLQYTQMQHSNSMERQNGMQMFMMHQASGDRQERADKAPLAVQQAREFQLCLATQTNSAQQSNGRQLAAIQNHEIQMSALPGDDGGSSAE